MVVQFWRTEEETRKIVRGGGFWYPSQTRYSHPTPNVQTGLWFSGRTSHSHCGDASSILARSTLRLVWGAGCAGASSTDMKPKAIIFDVGGVLRYSSKALHHATKKAFENNKIGFQHLAEDLWKLRGFESETSDVLVENPRTHVWDKETGQIKKTIENLGLEGDVFLSGAKEQLSEELARLDASSPLMDLDTGAQLQTSLSSDLLGKLWSPSDTRRKHYQVAQDYKIVTEEGQLKLVNAVRWMMTKTPLSDVDGTLGLLDRIKELDALRQKEGEPRRTIRVLDWGSGEGVALIALKKWLNEAAIADVELIGYSNIYYLSWHNAPEGITFIFDVAENLINHLEGKKIDLIYSRFGMYHYTSEEIDRDAVVQHFRDLGGLLSSEGEIRSDFFYLLDSEVAAGGFDIMPITGKMGTKMRPIKDGVEDMEFTSDEIRDTSDSFTKGGIDLNPALLDLQIKRDGNGVPLPLPMQPIENMHIEGFLPVIINITPVTNLPLLLGLADTEQDMEETMPAMKAREPEEVSYLN